VERLIGTIRREFLGRVPFWTCTDFERKLVDFKDYYSRARTHRSLAGRTPIPSTKLKVAPDSIVWRSHCRSLYELPTAA